MLTQRPLLLVLFVSLGLLAACGKKGPDDSPVIATVNGETISEKDLETYQRARQQEPLPDKDKERQLVLDELIDRLLLTQKAVDSGLDQNPEISIRLKRIRENLLIQELDRKLSQDTPVTEADLKKRFQEESEKTHKTEYRVRHILVKTEAEGQDIIKQLQGGANFAKLAKEKSIDQGSGANGGELGWVNQGMVVPEFFEGILATKKGTVTGQPVKSDFGWHVIKVEDLRPLKLPTVDQFLADRESKARLFRQMRDEKINALIKDLRAKAKITTR